MRYLLFLLLLLLLACTRQAMRPDCAGAIGIDQRLVLPDGHSLTLTRVNNERCPCNANCVWEGNVVTELEDAAGGKLLVADRSRGGGSDTLTRVMYRGFTISIDTVRIFAEACDPSTIPQADYCVKFTVGRE